MTKEGKRKFLENEYLGRINNDKTWNVDNYRSQLNSAGHTDDDIASASNEQLASWLVSDDVDTEFDDWHKQNDASLREKYAASNGISADDIDNDNTGYLSYLKDQSPTTYEHIYGGEKNGNQPAAATEQAAVAGDENNQPATNNSSTVVDGSINDNGYYVSTGHPGDNDNEDLQKGQSSDRTIIETGSSKKLPNIQTPELQSGASIGTGTIKGPSSFSEMSNDDRYKGITDVIQGYADQLKKLQEEDENKTKEDQRRGFAIGLAEVAASLANLIGVSKGAVSQNFKSYTQDWMKQAEENARYRRSRMDNIRERQRAIQTHLEQMRQQDFQFNQRMEQAERHHKEGLEAAERQTERRIEASQESEQRQLAAKKEDREAQINAEKDLLAQRTKANQALEESHFENQLVLHGITRNSDGTYSYNLSGGKTDKPRSSSGVKMRIPGATIIIGEKTLSHNVYNIFRNADSLSADDKKAIEGIYKSGKSADEISRKLEPYLKKYPSIANELRGVSYYIFDDNGYGQGPTGNDLKGYVGGDKEFLASFGGNDSSKPDWVPAFVQVNKK